MRRGPKLHYSPLSLGTGFGVNANTENVAGGGTIKGDCASSDSDVELQPKFDTEGARQNVLDYRNASMLTFIFLTYVRFSTEHITCD